MVIMDRKTTYELEREARIKKNRDRLPKVVPSSSMMAVKNKRIRNKADAKAGPVRRSTRATTKKTKEKLKVVAALSEDEEQDYEPSSSSESSVEESLDQEFVKRQSNTKFVDRKEFDSASSMNFTLEEKKSLFQSLQRGGYVSSRDIMLVSNNLDLEYGRNLEEAQNMIEFSSARGKIDFETFSAMLNNL